ncbi:MAG: D-alanyl-D-alanine carboxypeptidase/D-alanyl-D-alanine-endopeptidase [Arachidicoccus sp.]|nr:D-alanyl-D-alanine carboxypeptidase/D-alanyl-D-alanine-endopeptidase [Arachidicoccus sp.]
MRILFSFLFLCIVSINCCLSQSVKINLSSKISAFLQDDQMKNASLSFYVDDAATGDEVYEYDGERGLAPASSQKIFTTIASFEILGSDYTFKTGIGYNGNLSDGVLKGNLLITGYGDPTFGSWRYQGYKPEDVKNKLLSKLSNAGIRAIDGNIIIDESNWGLNPTPGGWPWDDIGNYYGAGDWGINWNENQINYTLKPNGSDVSVIKTDPPLQGAKIINRISAQGSEDKSIIYAAPYSPIVNIEGTIPSGKLLTITGAAPNPPLQFGYELNNWLKEKNIYCTGEIKTAYDYLVKEQTVPQATKNIGTYSSPELHDIVFHFLRKSVNLYGESFAKALGWQNKKDPSTSSGVSIIKQFWYDHGIGNSELHMIDGSGLSPQNYVTAHAEVKALLYAKNKDWFHYFYDALPTYNDMKMKSGTISGCKAFAGYQTSKNGKQYVFSIIINNYSGSQYSILRKIYTVLDLLK